MTYPKGKPRSPESIAKMKATLAAKNAKHGQPMEKATVEDKPIPKVDVVPAIPSELANLKDRFAALSERFAQLEKRLTFMERHPTPPVQGNGAAKVDYQQAFLDELRRIRIVMEHTPAGRLALIECSDCTKGCGKP